MSEIINRAARTYFPDEKVKIIAEPGRYFVETSFTVISKIHAKREGRLPDGTLVNKQYYLNDGAFGSFLYVTAGLLKTEPQHFVVSFEITQDYMFAKIMSISFI